MKFGYVILHRCGVTSFHMSKHYYIVLCCTKLLVVYSFWISAILLYHIMLSNTEC